MSKEKSAEESFDKRRLVLRESLDRVISDMNSIIMKWQSDDNELDVKHCIIGAHALLSAAIFELSEDTKEAQVAFYESSVMSMNFQERSEEKSHDRT